jgi:hypothetical protein
MWSAVVSEQRLGKYVPAATDTNAKQKNGVSYMIRAEMF